MHLYAFGSLCRGDFDHQSDIDLLAITERLDERLIPRKFSIYSYTRIRELWINGNPFAWHLFSESRLLHSSDNTDFLLTLGEPHPYSNVLSDCSKFKALFEDSASALNSHRPSVVFELSTIFLAIRNFATCFALGKLGQREFSRLSSIKLNSFSIEIDHDVLNSLQKCRILSTRGLGEPPPLQEVTKAIAAIPTIRNWMNGIMKQLR